MTRSLHAPARSERRKADRVAPGQGGGRCRVVIESISPSVDGGRFPAKRVTGERVLVEADIFADGHDKISAVVLHREVGGEGGAAGGEAWREVPMTAGVNDHWSAEFAVHAVGEHEFTVRAWIDPFLTWRLDLGKRLAAGQDVSVDLLIGAGMIAGAAERADGEDRRTLLAAAGGLRSGAPAAERAEVAMDEAVGALMWRHAERAFAAEGPVLRVVVDRPRARFGAWYELFPRSASPDPHRHGTFRDVESRLGYVAGMGFDVLYLPPIHPIGRAFRKGKNNAPVATPEDDGSPWAIGGPEGGHKAVHPELGTLADFDRLVAAAEGHGIEIALDLAYQCSPDHPYVREHPEWFRKRPDGTIQYAENPPKKYQDIYPFDFECDAWESLWQELLSVVLFWVDHGVQIFRVDNPHTKAFAFWEWMIGEVKRRHPGVIFLSEAFTRPRVMYRLAKLGFTQSYTYFAWRNGPRDLEEYFTELTGTGVAEFFRPNAWPNTPDILTEYLQHGGRPAAMARVVLAATLCASYGIYGPALELVENRAREPGSEEYLDSEKYQRRVWDLASPGSLREFITRVNRIRKENPALRQDRTLRFHRADNPALVCYSKREDGNCILCVVNTNPYREQWGTVELDLPALGIGPDQPFQVHDMITDARYTWRGPRAVVGLNPHVTPAHVFRVRTRARSEHDFEYFL